jgi:hypothetical protein
MIEAHQLMLEMQMFYITLNKQKHHLRIFFQVTTPAKPQVISSQNNGNRMGSYIHLSVYELPLVNESS